MVDCKILIDLLEIEEPELFEHFKEYNYNIYLNNVLIKWFVALFVQTVERKTFLTIWDCMFFEGNIALFKTALALLSLNREHLMSLKNVEEFSKFLTSENIKVESQESLRDYILNRTFTFNMKYVNKLRAKYTPEAEKEVIRVKNELRSNQLKYLNKSCCNRDWSFCEYKIHDEYCKKDLVLRTLNGVEFIDNNFFNLDGITQRKIEVYRSLKDKIKKYREEKLKPTDLEYINQFDEYKNLIVERKKHTDNCLKSFFLEHVKKIFSEDEMANEANIKNDYEREIQNILIEKENQKEIIVQKFMDIHIIENHY